MKIKSVTGKFETMTNKQKITNKQDFEKSYKEHNGDATLQIESISSGDNQKAEKVSDIQDLSFTEKVIQDIDPVDAEFLRVVSRKVSVLTLPSTQKIENGTPETLTSRRVLPISFNKNVLDSVLQNSRKEDSKLLIDPQIKTLKEEVSTLIQQCIGKEDAIFSLEKQLSNSEKDRAELQMRCRLLEQESIKLKKLSENSIEKAEAIQRQLKAAKASVEDTNKSKKSEAAAKSCLAKRLAESLLLKDKLMSDLRDAKDNLSDLEKNSKKQVEDLKSKIEVLTKQKQELLEVVKKQMNLNKNLKRQILHLKAGFSQKYIEQEVFKSAEN